MAAPGSKKPRSSLLLGMACVAVLSFVLGQRLRVSHSSSHESSVHLTHEIHHQQHEHQHRSRDDSILLVTSSRNAASGLGVPALAEGVDRPVAAAARMHIIIRTTTAAATEVVLGTWLQKDATLRTNASIHASLLLPQHVSRHIMAKLIHQRLNATIPVDHIGPAEIGGGAHGRDGDEGQPSTWGTALDHVCHVAAADGSDGGNHSTTSNSSSTSNPYSIGTARATSGNDYWVLVWDTVLLSVHAVARYLPHAWSPDDAVAIIGSLTTSHSHHREDVPLVIMTRHAVQLYCAYRRTHGSACSPKRPTFTTCLPAAGVTVLNHKGILGTTTQDLLPTPHQHRNYRHLEQTHQSLPLVSNILAVAGLPQPHWPYYDYFLNRFYSMPAP